MPTLASAHIPAPKSWDEFEDIALSASKLRWGSTEFFRNGRQGQRQDGVDIFGTSEKGDFLGVQCKNSVGGVSESVVLEEISNAESFQPEISQLYIATTANRDAVLQKKIRLISRKREEAGKFTVSLLFWEDISSDLCLDETVFLKHYPQFSPKVSGPLKHDKALFEEFKTLLPSNGVINFIDKHNMAGFSFLDSDIDPIREFYYEWAVPERTFMDSQIELIRKRLWTLCDEYLELIALETDSIGAKLERRTVPADWEFERPEHFWKVVKQFHELAGKIVETHRELMFKGREKYA